MKVSFIIPVYKVEKYLGSCVQSILKQTYNDYEILLVDDGSPDKCPEICDYWARADDRIKALHKSNGGLSDARNYGLKHAIGKYVVFVDSDDYWTDENDLMNLMNFAHDYPDADFICFNCQYVYPDGKVAKWKPYSDQILQSSDKNIILQNLVKSGTFPMSACLKLISRKFIISNNLYFKKNILSEDIPWFINMMDYTGECRFVNLYIYAYRQGVNGSISSSFSKKNYNDLYDILRHEFEILDNRSFGAEAKKALLSFLAYEYSILLSNVGIWGIDRKKKIEDLRQYDWLLQYKENPKVRLVSNVKCILGLYATFKILSVYQSLRTKIHFKF